MAEGRFHQQIIETNSRFNNFYFGPKHAVHRRAAVLVLLLEREGDLRVLLTTRSKNLRSHPGQTALLGGKYEETDGSLVYTTVRPVQVAALFIHYPTIHSIWRLSRTLRLTSRLIISKQ